MFIALMLTGYLIQIIIKIVFETHRLYDIVVKILVNTLYYFLIPATLFVVFSNRGFLNIDLFITLYFTLFMVTVYYVSKKLFINETHYVVFMLSTFPNSVFLGFPVSYILFGNIRIASMMGALTVAFNIIVPDLLVRRKISLKSILSSLSIHGFLIGVFLHYISPNEITRFITTPLWWITPLTTYLAVLTMGLRIPMKITGISQYVKPVLFITIARFIYAPLLSILITGPIGFNTEDVFQLMVISMMPPAVLNIVIAQKYNWNSPLTAFTIAFLTIMFLIIILPLLIILI